MVKKKRYVKPEVESEHAMEQTSLGCNASIFPMEDICDWPPSAIMPGGGPGGPPACEVNIGKGGVFSGTCDEYLNLEPAACVVILS